MLYILQIDFPYTGPWGEEMHTALTGLAQSISLEPGFLCKYWTENPEKNEAGGIYFFSDKVSAETYLAMHTARLKDFGILSANAKIFEVNEALSRINQAPI